MAKTESPACDLIKVRLTDKDELRRIMIHEFPKASGNYLFPTLDEQKVIDRGISPLTCEQKMFLRTCPSGSQQNRLVMFITEDTNDDRLMGAVNNHEHKKPADIIRATHSLHIFHCKRDDDPTLLCFSRFFHKTATGTITTNQCSAASKNLTTYKIGAAKVGDTSAIYHRLYTKEGTNVMPGNFIHGGLNTLGCWMMLRNYNWPQTYGGAPAYGEFAQAQKLMEDKTPGKPNPLFPSLPPDPAYQEKLRSLGYRNQAGDYDTSANESKFLSWDRNYAYFWLMRDLVGIEYFSKLECNHDCNVDGAVHLPEANKSYLEAAARESKRNLKGFAGHNSSGKAAAALKDTLFRDNNVLGFKPQETWEGTWADVVFYR